MSKILAAIALALAVAGVATWFLHRPTPKPPPTALPAPPPTPHVPPPPAPPPKENPALAEIRGLMKNRRWGTAYRKACDTPDAASLAWECVLNGSMLVGGSDSRQGPIALMRIPAGKAVKLCDAAGPLSGRTPSLSPDGRLLAFSQTDGRTSTDKISILRSDGSGPITVLESGVSGYDRGPAWSADGKRMAFARSSGRDDDFLCSINIDGSGFMKYPIGQDPARSVSWSPDGKRLACVRSNNGRWSVSVVDPSLHECKVIADPGGHCWSPRWSPNGGWIVFVGTSEGKPSAFVVRPDGGDLNCLTPSDASVRAVAWAPGGDKIFFYGSIEPEEGLYVVPIKGGKPELLMKVSWSIAWLSCGPPLDEALKAEIPAIPVVPAQTEVERKKIAEARAMMKERKWKSAYDVVRDIPAAKLEIDECIANGSRIVFETHGWTDGAGYNLVARNEIGSFASWSPDGRSIAYYKPGSLNVPVHVMSIPAALTKRIDAELRFNVNYRPAWSPDGKFLAVTITDDTVDPMGHRIVLLGVEDGKVKNLLTGSDFGGDPSWSPDGKRIAFVSQRSYAGRPSRLLIMNSDGSAIESVTGDGFDLQPRWSPDGKRIAFLSAREGPGGTGGYLNLFVVDPDGRNERAVAGGEYSIENPMWSPDGRWILFQADRRDNLGMNLYIVPAEGGEPQSITAFRGNHGHATWGPDSRRVAYTRDDNGMALPFLKEIGASEPRAVKLDRRWHAPPIWSPLNDE